MNNKNFSNFGHLIYPAELVVKDITDYSEFPTLNLTLTEHWKLHFMTTWRL